MILVVVAVHAIAPDEKDVGDRVDVGANAAKLGITPEIRGIGLWHPNDRGVDDIRRVDEVDLFQFRGRKRAHVGVRKRPQIVVLAAKVLEAKPHLGGVRYQCRAPVVEDLQPAKAYV